MAETSAISVIGAGGWGTALAILLASSGRPIRLWAYDPEHARDMQTFKENRPFLPGVPLPEQVEVTTDLAAAVAAEVLVVVPPSTAMRSVAARMAASGVPSHAVLVSCTKGLEHHTGCRMSQILSEALPGRQVAALSGPNHAEEVARLATPAAAVLACADAATGEMLQRFFCTGPFRAYTSPDVAGVELGGALKNIYALAAGAGDGLGLGDNAKAALVTRALAEMTRLGTALGGRRETFAGLSGIGDLIVTCFSRHSRNRMVGERLGRGESLAEIQQGMVMVAEGVPTTESAWEQARALGLDTPLLDAVRSVLRGQTPPREALERLLNRAPRPEPEHGV